MDFQLVADTVLRSLQERQINFAAMGGFALGFWGVTRSTIDMDFLLLLDDASGAEAVLDDFGYKSVYKTENVCQLAHNDAQYGTIDFIYAFREISRTMLARAVPVAVSSELSINCLLPEDIIGLKLQALVNDPAREQRDLADMEALIAAKRTRDEPIDWQLLEEYFTLFEKQALLARLKRTHDPN